MLKENTVLINKDLLELEKGYTYVDIVDMIEMSYMLANKEEMHRFSDELLDYSIDGIITYGALVKFCYDKYIGSAECSISEFMQTDFESHIEEFKKKYFIDTEYENTRKCLEFIDKQFEETKYKENISNARDLIKEIIAELSKKYDI